MKHPILRAGGLLLIFTVISVFFVALTFDKTQTKIAFNEQQLLIKRLGELVEGYDNDILKDKFLTETQLHGLRQTVVIYLAKKHQQTFAYLIEHTYPNGYNGNIRLLTGVDVNQQLLGVRVITHKETPGLGDKIETRKSNWIQQFRGLSLSNPNAASWKVKRDGGAFDAFTGATITPRAIVTATYDVLNLFAQQDFLNKLSGNATNTVESNATE